MYTSIILKNECAKSWKMYEELFPIEKRSQVQTHPLSTLGGWLLSMHEQKMRVNF